MSGTRTGTLLEQIRRLSVGPDAADAELLSRFVRGRDEDAFAELLRRHGPMVFGVGRRVLANDKDAEDVLRRLVRRGLTLSAAALATALEANTAAAVLPRKVTAAPVAVVVGQLAEKRSGASPALVAALVEQGLPSTAAHRSLLVLVGLLALGLATAASALRAPGGNQQPPPTKRPPPAEKVQPRTDRLGDPLPTGAVARLGTVRLRHDKPGVSNLTLLAFTPDSKVLLSADRSGALRFWEVATGKELRRLHVGDKESRWSDKEYRCFAVTSGCKLVAAANDDGIALWDVAATKKLGHLSVKGVQVVAFTPDGKMLAVSSPDKIVSLWDVGERKERLRLRGAKEVHTLRFTPDGKILVGSGRSGEISVWDVATGQLLRTLRGLDGPPGESQCLALSPDGKLLAAGGAERKPPATFNGRLVLWDLATGRELRRFQGHTYSVYSVAFTPDGKTLASAAYRSIRFWDVATGKELRRFQGSYWVSRFITFAPNGRVLASFTFEPTIRLWEVATGKPLHDYPGHQGDVMTVDFSPDGRLVVTGSHEWNNTHVRVWDAHTGEQRHLLRGHTAYVRRALFALNGKTIYSGSGDGTIRQWDVQTGKELRLLSISAKRKDLQDQVKTIVLSEDGKRLTSVSAGSGDPLQSKPTVVIWDLITGKQLTKRRSDPWDWAFLAARAGTFA